MGTKSEKLTNLINRNFFFSEFSYSNTLVEHIDETEIELADLIVAIGDVLIIYQLKERSLAHSKNESTEKKWYYNKVLKKAKKQINGTIEYLNTHKSIDLKNNRLDEIEINVKNFHQIFKIIIFDPSKELEEEIRKNKGLNSSESGFIHLITVADYNLICQLLHTPTEILEYFWFREENALKAQTVSESALLGYYFKGDYDYPIQEVHADVLEKYYSETHKFDMRFLIDSFKENIVDGNVSNEYYSIIQEIALLNRNELSEFRKRFVLAVEKSLETSVTSPYRLASPRLNCAYVFIPFPYGEDGDIRIPLENFTRANKYDLKLKKSIGLLVKREIESEFFQLHWCFMEHEWRYDDLLDDHLQRNNPFRNTRTKLVNKY